MQTHLHFEELTYCKIELVCSIAFSAMTVMSEFWLVLLQLMPSSSDLKDPGLDEGADLCEGVNIDDVTLNFESSYELFGYSHGHPRYQCDDAALDCLVMEKNLSVTESNSHVENAIEVHPETTLPFHISYYSTIFHV